MFTYTWIMELKEYSKCPLCSSKCVHFFATIAPWIELLAGAPPEGEIQFNICTRCDYKFFSRYPIFILNALYDKYRDSEYFEARNNWEPWYGKNENNAFIEGQQLEIRRYRFYDLILASGMSLNLESCIDFGGDLGQYIPKEITGRRYVVDFSSRIRKSDSDIVFVPEISNINHSVDLIMCCMVLEHLNDPLKIVKEIKDKLNLKGLFYIEVPQDSFQVSKFHNTSLYSRYLKFLKNNRYFFILLDFFTGISRLLFSRIPFWGVVKASEHINYFEYGCLENLLETSGFKVIVAKKIANAKQGKIRLGCLQILAEKVS